MIYTSLFWKIMQSSMAVAVTQNDSLGSAFTSVLLDVLSIIFLLFGLIVFGFSFRLRATAQSNVGTKPPRRPVAVLSVAMLALPLLGLIFVWSNIPSSSVPLTPTPIAHHTPTATPKPPLDLVTPGKLTVGTYTTYAPQEFIGADGKPTGFDIALANALAKKMNLKVNIVTQPFAQLLPNLASNALDIVIAGMPIDPTFQNQAEFVPYLKSVETLMVPKSNPNHIKNLNDLCGLTVGVVAGTTAENDLKGIDCRAMGKQDIIINDTQTDPAQIVPLLKNSQIDVAYLDVPVANYYMNTNTYKGLFTTVSTKTEAFNQGIAIRTGDTAINNEVMQALLALHNNGMYNTLIKTSVWDFSSEAYTGH